MLVQTYDELGYVSVGIGNVIHCICDKFDADIFTPNCKTCCHCLAMIMAQANVDNNQKND